MGTFRCIHHDGVCNNFLITRFFRFFNRSVAPHDAFNGVRIHLDFVSPFLLEILQGDFSHVLLLNGFIHKKEPACPWHFKPCIREAAIHSLI